MSGLKWNLKRVEARRSMNFKVIGLGEVLWDLLPSGPEMGGAPANVACHARALGAHAAVITRVGNDHFGQAICRRLRQMGVADGMVQVDESAPTGTVTVSLSHDGIPCFTIQERVAWDRLAVTPDALATIRTADAVCFGTLAQRNQPTRHAIQELVAAAPREALRVFDVNLRQNFFSTDIIEQSLRSANVLKLNESELSVLGGLFGLAGSARQQIEQLAGTYELQLVALTRGLRGSLLFQAGQWSDCPSAPIKIADTVGAGDGFTAAMIIGMLHQIGLDEINAFADEVARHICSCAGATPPLPKFIGERFLSAYR